MTGKVSLLCETVFDFQGIFTIDIDVFELRMIVFAGFLGCLEGFCINKYIYIYMSIDISVFACMECLA